MNGQLSASDVMALTKDNDGFGGVGLIILLFIFLIGLSGNGFGFGNNNTATALSLADIQASLYNQTQDSNSRQLQSNIATLNDSVLNNKYDNAILIKDLSNQLSNSIAGIGNLIQNQTNAIQGMFAENTIRELSDQVTVLRGQNSNLIQTAQITENILSNLAITAPKPPCYYCCGRQSL